MPEELLRSASADPRPSRRWCMLPVSVAAHGAAAVAWFVIPLTAGNLPVPARPSGIVAYVKPLPLPPPVTRNPRPASEAQSPRPAAPTQAPSVIEPERVVASSSVPDVPIDDALPPGAAIDGALPIPGPPPPPPPPPPPETQRQPVRAGVGVREPKKVVDVAPVYPRLAQQAQIQGIVVLEAVIDVDGRIDRLRVLRSTPLLDDAAIAAVKQWRYTPTLLNGVAVPVLITITVNFRLQ